MSVCSSQHSCCWSPTCTTNSGYSCCTLHPFKLQKRGKLNHSGPKHTHKWLSWLQTWRVPHTTSLIFWRKWHPATRISGQLWCTFPDRVLKSMHVYLQCFWWRLNVLIDNEAIAESFRPWIAPLLLFRLTC